MPLAAQHFVSTDNFSGALYFSIPLYGGFLYGVVSGTKLEDKSDPEVEIKRYLLGKQNFTLSDLKILLNNLMESFKEVVMVYEKHESILFGSVGGYVWMKRGDKWSFLSKFSETPQYLRGNMADGDVLVFGVGKDLEHLSDVGEKIGSGDEYVQALLVEKSMAVMLMDDDPDDFEEKEMVELKPSEKAPKEKVEENNWMKKIFDRKPKTANPEVYIKSDERKRLGRIVVLVLLLLVASIGFGWKKRKLMEREEVFAGVYEPALQLLIQAEELESDQPLASRDVLVEAKIKVERALESYGDESEERNKLVTLLSQIEQVYEKVSGEHVVGSAEVYFDLTLVKDSVFGEQMVWGDGWISVLDKSRGIVIGIEEESKQAQLLGGGDLLGGSKLISASTGKAVVLSQKGLVGLYFGSREPNILVDYEEMWQNPSALGMFGGNVYVIDSQVEEIWRYPGYDGGLGSRVRWFGPGVVPKLDSVIDVSVDGDMWVLSSGGSIRRFRRGAQMNFSILEMDMSLERATKIFSRLGKDELYVLDLPNKRVVVVGTDGGYKDQYVWEGMEGVSDLIVVESESGGIILLLSGSTIYQIPLGDL